MQDNYEEIIKDKQRRRLSYYKQVYLGDTGEFTESSKKLLQDLARICNVATPNGVASSFSDNAATMGFNEGKRYVFNYIMYHLNKDFKDINNLIQEAEYD